MCSTHTRNRAQTTTLPPLNINEPPPPQKKQAGRQHLRGARNEAALLALLPPADAARVLASRDPVLLAAFKALDLDRRYYAGKAVEWVRAVDAMYMEFCACVNVHTTPIPFAVRGREGGSSGRGGGGL